jgi:hypothetical protein
MILKEMQHLCSEEAAANGAVMFKSMGKCGGAVG